MSEGEIRTGRTIDEATKFCFGNLLSIIRVGWLPIAITIAVVSFLAWTFWQPIILAYIDFLQAFNAAAGDAATLEHVMEGYTDQMEAAVLEVGIGKFLFGELLVIVAALIGLAIPMVAYSRMIVLGETYSAPFYLRFGRAEINVALTYFIIIVIVSVVPVVLMMIVMLGVAAVAQAFGDGANAIVAMSMIFLMIAMLALLVWLFARLGVALPASAIEGGIPLRRAWTLTKGVSGKLGWAVFLGYLVLTVLSLVFLMALGTITGVIMAILTGLGSQLAPYFIGTLWGIGYVALYCFSTAYLTALLAGPYKRLTQS